MPMCRSFREAPLACAHSPTAFASTHYVVRWYVFFAPDSYYDVDVGRCVLSGCQLEDGPSTPAPPRQISWRRSWRGECMNVDTDIGSGARAGRGAVLTFQPPSVHGLDSCIMHDCEVYVQVGHSSFVPLSFPSIHPWMYIGVPYRAYVSRIPYPAVASASRRAKPARRQIGIRDV